MKQIRTLLSSALALTLTISCVLPIGVSAAKSFSDVKGHWASSYISNAVKKGYVNGYENGTFKPDNSVTRAEFCKMLNNALSLKGLTSVDFTDVSSGSWYFEEVRKSVAAGYIAGYEDSTFRGDSKISRQEAAVVIARIASDTDNKKDLSNLRDGSTIESWAQDSARAVYSKGYMAGDEQKKFRPKGNLTRGESVKIIESILDGEKISETNTTLSASSQTISDTVYTGNVTASGSGTTTLQNCRVLGTLDYTGSGTLSLDSSNISTLKVKGGSSAPNIIASGNSAVQSTTVSGGASLKTQSSGQFKNVDLSGSNISSQTINLSGTYQNLTISTPVTLSLSSATVKKLKLLNSASGSKIDLSSSTVIDRAELTGSGEFTGKGIIKQAIMKGSGSTFETPPLSSDGSTTSPLSATFSPKSGATDVSLKPTITVSFNETPLTSNKSSLNTDYVKSSLIELKKGSDRGDTVTFDVSLSNNNRTISITPRTALDSSTKYYIMVKSALKNSAGQSNASQSSYFTTQAGMIPTTYPVDGATTIPVNTPIRLNFSESVYQTNGSSSLRSSDLQDAIEIHRDSKNSSNTVSFNASMSNSNKTITITPKDDLSTDRTYYVVLKSGTIANSGRSTNKEHSFYFKTAETDVLVPVMDPSPGSKEVSVDTDIVLDFDTKLYDSSGDSFSNSYLKDSVFTLSRGSSGSNAVEIKATLSNDSEVVTISPQETLRYDTTYYLNMKKKTLSDSTSSGRDYNAALTFSFTTEKESSRGTLAPTPTPKSGAKGVGVSENIKLTFDTAVYKEGTNNVELSDSYLEDSVIELYKDSLSGDSLTFDAEISSSNKVITIDPYRDFTKGTKYYVIVKEGTIQNSSGTRNDKFSTSFTCGNNGVLVPEITPKDGTTVTDKRPTITLEFNEALYNDSNKMLSDNGDSHDYIEDKAIELHEGSEGGKEKYFSVKAVYNNRKITLTPDEDLIEGKTYYLLLRSDRLRNADKASISYQTFRFTIDNSSNLILDTHVPGSGSSSISCTSEIKLNFNQTVKKSTGGDLDNSYLTQNISFKKGGSGGTDVGFTASASGKTITMKPSFPLDVNTTYYVGFSANVFSGTSTSKKNNSGSFTFTTTSSSYNATLGSTSHVTNGGTQAITLNFPSTLYRYSSPSNALTDAEAKAALTVNGSSSNFTCVVSGSTITITPGSPWSASNTVSLAANKIRIGSSKECNGGGTFAVTPAGVGSITSPSTFRIEKVKTNGTQEVRLSFNASVYQVNTTTPLDASYITNNFKLRKDSSTGEIVTIGSASMAEDNKTIVLTLGSPLLPGTTYYITAAANVVSDASGRKNTSITANQTSYSPTITMEVINIGKKTAKLKINYDYPATFDIRLSGGGYTNEPVRKFSVSDVGTKDLDLLPLAEGISYKIALKYTCPGVERTLPEIAFTTKVTDATLKEIAITDGDGPMTPIIPTSSTEEVWVKKGTVTVTPRANDLTATIEVTGDGVTGGSANTYTVEVANTDVDLTITVTADGKTETYTLTLKPRAG